jgi:1-acyl-sn-glycerol-3-phosphate acyltransferase
MIIKAGRNIYPPEIEDIAADVRGVRKGCVAAFGAGDAEQGTEKFVIVAETYERDKGERDNIVTGIIGSVAGNIGVPPDQVILVEPRTVPKTSSGKLRRSDCRQAYLEGKLDRSRVPAWIQILKLSLDGVIKKTAKGLVQLSKVIYSGYIVTVSTAVAFPLFFSAFLLPKKVLRKYCKICSRIIVFLSGCPLSVEGKEHREAEGISVFVANHSSYIDSIILTSLLPEEIVFVTKEEFLKIPVFGPFLKKMGHITVDRQDFEKSLSITEKFEEALTEGSSVVIFAEGTFTYATGLRPFKLGAFKLAADTKIPVSPVSLKGTRKVLRDESFLFRPGRIEVHFSKPICPEKSEWNEIIRLRNSARAEIAKHCGEPLIDLVSTGVNRKGG